MALPFLLYSSVLWLHGEEPREQRGPEHAPHSRISGGRLPYFRLPEELELRGAARSLGARSAAELHEDVPHVHVDRPRADEEVSCDLLVRRATRDQADDLELATGDPRFLCFTR
jgi:hypothetical protein